MNLSEIHSPDDIKNLSHKEVKQLAKDLRSKIIETVGQNGGHLASNLGVVELTLALHRVFNSPTDAIIWDVSHQCYAHKLLTGRYSQFSTLRQSNGITGFTNISESNHDFFISGHASTSISSALGLLTARRLKGETGKVIAVIGDGALTGGMAFEALSHAGQLANDLIVVLNDNQMSIDHNTGSISRYLSRLAMTKSYQNFRHKASRIKKILPFKGKHLGKFVFRFKRSLKGLFYANNFFTDLGFEYVGPLDGHSITSLENVFKRVSHIRGPVVIHVVTKKGKGYEPAEKNPGQFHGVGPFNKLQNNENLQSSIKLKTYTEVFSDLMMEYGEKKSNLTAITAAMAQGTGLAEFGKHYPKRFFDVGIAEEHAVTFAGGLAKGGLLPVVAIYSTFMQRSVDQLIHDISLQNLHCIFMLDRAGAVPGDGVTHQGIFDISLFRTIPDMMIMSPATVSDMKNCFHYAVDLCKSNSVVIRYPKNVCPVDFDDKFNNPAEEGKGVLVQISDGDVKSKVLAVCTGGMYSETVSAIREGNVSADVYSLRFIKPFDFDYFYNIARDYKGLVFVEDGIITGSISETIGRQLLEKGYKNFVIGAFSEKYYEQGTRSEILEAAGISVSHIQKMLQDVLNG